MVSDWRLAKPHFESMCWAHLRELERQRFVPFRVYVSLRADVVWMPATAPSTILRAAIPPLAAARGALLWTPDSEHYRGVNDRMGVMNAPAAAHYFGRARFVEHGWNESRHSSTEGLLLYALRQGGVRRGTFPTLSAVGCCVGERCESFQANRQCHMLCLGPGTAALAVKYKYEGWLAAAHAATLQDGTRNRTIVPCSKGLCIEGAPKPSWACARVRRAVGGLPCPSFPRWLALEPTGTSAARQMACNNVDADAASSP